MDYYGDIEFVTAFAAMDERRWINHLSGRNYHTLQFQAKGHIEFDLEGEGHVSLEAPSVLLTRPGASCHFGNAKQPWSHSYLGVRGERVDRMEAEGLLPFSPGQKCLLVKIGNGEMFQALFRQCVRHVRAGTPLELALAANDLERLLLQLVIERAQSLAESSEGEHSLSLKRLAGRIKSSPLEDWNFEREAKALGISSGHFARLFKELTGLPPKHYVLKCRLDLAAEMLATSNEPIKSVAGAAGFDDLQYFYRRFVSERGVPPAEFRKRFSDAYRLE